MLTNNSAALIAERAKAVEWIGRLNASPTLETVEPYMPLLFSLNGKPYSLDDHFPFKSLFRTRIPRKRVLCTARQVGKSQNICALGIMTAARIPYSKQLFMTPLFEQVRRFSANYIQPFIDESIIKSLIVDSSCNQSILQKTFINKALMIFSYAYLSANRTRGIGGIYSTSIDEFQDMDLSHLPIIVETMSAAPKPWGILSMTGTPKGFDNSIQAAWNSSSQAEWVVRCRKGGCNHWNFCSTEFDLWDMIGPVHDDVGPAHKGGVPGTICSRCKTPIDPRWGTWLHRYREQQWDYQGFHVPQILLPMHYEDRVAWATLNAKKAGLGNTPRNVFINEVLGESCDTGAKLLTLRDLRAACVLEWENDPRTIPELPETEKRNYLVTVMAIDWGGGGGDGIISGAEGGRRKRISFTKVAYMGIRVDGRVDVIWGCRLDTPNDHALEASYVYKMYDKLRPNFIAHDFSGAGSLRQTLLVQSGVPVDYCHGFVYGTVPTRKRLQFVPGDGRDTLSHFRIDKTFTLLLTIQAIKTGMVRFFQYDNKGDNDDSLLSDFLALTEEKVETGGTDRYIIRRLTAFSDDFAHAVNLGCIALWHGAQLWPSFDGLVKCSPAADEGGQFLN